MSHLVPVETRFHPTEVDVVYSRYRRRGDLSLDESFFPVIWDETGGRSAWLARAARSAVGQEGVTTGSRPKWREGLPRRPELPVLP